MFNAQQFACFKQLATEPAGSAIVTFDRSRLDDKNRGHDRRRLYGLFRIYFFAGVMLYFALGLSIVLKDWLFFSSAVVGLVGLAFGSKALLKNRGGMFVAPPNFVFDDDLQSLFILNNSSPVGQNSHYECYASRVLIN
ncbi:hypothetical protein [Hymenobacter terricola]|uniref:hypothetical protein n=1 Tax=Hymenobacter terricola TaxID=2819236 RepID=UPI001B313876|nr:hypothetical protein [Hymenobacter terricola]